MRVLLLSPLPRLDPPNGDVTYTQLLLSSPPADVVYTTYEEALSDGRLEEFGCRKAVRKARAEGRAFGTELARTVACHVLNRLRRWRLLFNEPIRFFRVRPGAFDLIHLHVFSARFMALPCPLVVSNAAPLRYLYTNAFNYGRGRTCAMERAEMALGRLLGVNVNSYHLPQATRLMVMTEFLRHWYVSRRVMPEDRIDVVPIGLPPTGANRSHRRPTRVGFVAAHFRIKGGQTLLRAWDNVLAAQPRAELWIVGSPPELAPDVLASKRITWLPRVPRDRLLADVLPSFDVFAYPTPFDGQPLVVLEAMAAGVPVATSDYQAVPELVDHGRAGLISRVGDATGLAQNILRLLEPDTNRAVAEAAQRRFAEHYSTDAVRPKIRRSYERALVDFYAARGRTR